MEHTISAAQFFAVQFLIRVKRHGPGGAAGGGAGCKKVKKKQLVI